MKKPLRPLFNSLSRISRLQLHSAAAVTALTGFAREDTQKHPVRSVGYLGMIGLLLATMPIPLPLIQSVPLLCLYLLVRTRCTPWACRAHDQLSQAFNSESVMRTHSAYVEGSEERPDMFRIKKWPLARDTFFTVCRDGRDVAQCGWGALKRCFS